MTGDSLSPATAWRQDAIRSALTPADFGLAAVPAPNSKGVTPPGRPAGSGGIVLYLTSADSITFTIATAQPVTDPTLTITVSGGSYAQWSETLGPNTNLYVTAKTGNPNYRYV